MTKTLQVWALISLPKVDGLVVVVSWKELSN